MSLTSVPHHVAGHGCGGDGPAASAAAEALRRSAHLDRPSMTVLSLGCGADDGLDRLLAAGFRVAGADVDAGTVAAGKERLAALGHRRLDLRQAPVTCLPWTHQSFDVVISGRLLADVATADSIAATREVMRLLRPGGLLVARVAVPPSADSASPEPDREIRRHWSAFDLLDLQPTHGPAGDGAPAAKTALIVAKRREFTDDFAAAFREVLRCRCDAGPISYGGDLRDRILAVLPMLGYRTRDRDVNLVLVPRHKWEHRLVPLLVFGRHADSDPFLLYEVRGGVITLKIFGPLDAERRSPFVHFDIDCTAGLPAIDESIVRAGPAAVHRGIAVGVHATERLLRSADLRNHASTDLPDEAAGQLESLVATAVRRRELLDSMFRALRPFTVYSGHDCYDDAVDVSVALDLHAPVLVQPKGKMFQHYGADDGPGRWTPDGTLFRSHLNRRFEKEVAGRWNSMDPTFVADARGLMERRMGSLSALPYMRNVCYRDLDSNGSVGWRNFRDALGVPVYEPGRPRGESRVAWILSLHSFADEPFRWGMDRLWSLYEMFLVAARQVRDAFPNDVLVLRPHPNSLSLFTDPGLIREVESGARRGPTDLLDIYLQLRLCQAIATLGVTCELSSLQPTEELLRPERSIVVTRHGSILIEAAWMGRTGIFSRVAPYSSLYPVDVQFDDADSLRAAMRVNRERVLAGTPSFPSRDDIAKYQAILDTPMGVKRAGVMGEVDSPNAAVRPMRNFDDFRYGPETIEQAAARLLSRLSAPGERAALEAIFGRSRSGA